jgi:hypothetical protein
MNAPQRPERAPAADSDPADALAGMAVADRFAAYRRAMERLPEAVADDPDAHAVASIMRLAAREGRVADTLRDVGLAGRTGLTPAHAERLRRRNELIRSAVRQNLDWSEARPTVAATLLQAAFRRYEATSWPRDRAAATPPNDAVRAHFWRILKMGLTVQLPATIATLVKIIDGETE